MPKARTLLKYVANTSVAISAFLQEARDMLESYNVSRREPSLVCPLKATPGQNADIWTAVRQGNVAEVERLVDQGEDLEERFEVSGISIVCNVASANSSQEGQVDNVSYLFVGGLNCWQVTGVQKEHAIHDLWWTATKHCSRKGCMFGAMPPMSVNAGIYRLNLFLLLQTIIPMFTSEFCAVRNSLICSLGHPPAPKCKVLLGFPGVCYLILGGKGVLAPGCDLHTSWCVDSFQDGMIVAYHRLSCNGHQTCCLVW